MNEFEQKIIESMRVNSNSPILLEERNELLLYLHRLLLVTGRIDIMFCNAFLTEAIQLLTNSIFLYEDGLFDCAFYSVRQAGEVVNSMYYLASSNREELEKWSAKKHFPMNSKIKTELEKLSDDYNEIQRALPDIFSHHKEVIKKSHKIIHKQGFDTFYKLRNQSAADYNFSQSDETALFLDALKYTIGVVLITFILLEPISLALADDDVTMKINFNFMTEPIDIRFFDKYLNQNEIVAKIKETEFYRGFISFFADKEPMSPAVYSVVHEEAWDIDALAEIEKQLDLLNTYERFMFCILRSGIQVSSFYFNGGLSWYFTSITSNYDRHTFGGSEFEQYLKSDKKFNLPCDNVYMSVINMYDEPLFFEHSKPLVHSEIKTLEMIEEQGTQL